VIIVKEYSRKIRKSEARHRYWHIQNSDKEFFPDTDVVFKLEFDGDVYEMKINHKNDIMTGKLYTKRRFLEDDRIIVKKKNAKLYSLDAPDTGLYPS
jgi:hypothetical protein